MTEREICERIVADGGCMSISCYGHDLALNVGVKCPLFGTCLSQIDSSVARQWLADHPVGREVRCDVCVGDENLYGDSDTLVVLRGHELHIHMNRSGSRHILGFDIAYCPVCGRKLAQQEVSNA